MSSQIPDIFRGVWRVILSAVEKVPLIGGLINCNRKDFSEAFVELATKLIFSLMPIWLWTLYSLFPEEYRDKQIKDILVDTVSHGELLLYCTSLLAPVFYIALSERKGARTFPNKLSHIVLVVIIMVVSAVFYIFHRKGETPNKENLFIISLTFYLISVILIYIATVYKNSILSPTEKFQSEEKDFINQYNNHRQ